MTDRVTSKEKSLLDMQPRLSYTTKIDFLFNGDRKVEIDGEPITDFNIAG